MKASELRLGNYFEVPTMPYLGLQKVQAITGQWISGIDVDKIAPIDLTEEWLLKLGFKNEIPLHWFNKVIINNYKGGFIEKMYGMEIKHVHQLQNLYFSLCGEELTIK